MSNPKDKDENAKNKDWQTPMNIPGVKPNDYNAATDTSSGTQNSAKMPDNSKAPYTAGHIDPAGKAAQAVTDNIRKLATQGDISG